MAKYYTPSEYLCVRVEALKAVYQSIEEYVGLDDVYCVIRNGYVSINCNDILVRRLRLDNLKEELPEGYVDNNDITIVIDDIETFAVYNK